jgi:hypothetical protein
MNDRCKERFYILEKAQTIIKAIGEVIMCESNTFLQWDIGSTSKSFHVVELSMFYRVIATLSCYYFISYRFN